MATSYQMLLDAVENYYGSGSDQWAFIFQNIGNVTEAGQVAKLLKQVPGVDVTLSNEGRILDYNVRDVLKGFSTTENIGTAVNSNNVGSVVGKSINASIPSVISKSTTTGSFGGVSGIGLTPDTGVTVSGVLKTVGLGLIGVGVGATVGKIVGDALYNANPDFWATGNLSKLSKTDFNKFVTTIKDERNQVLTEGALTLWGVDGDTTTMYVDENAVAYMTWYLNSKGLFTEKTTYIKENDSLPPTPNVTYPFIEGSLPLSFIQTNNKLPTQYIANAKCAFFKPAQPSNTRDGMYLLFANETPFNVLEYQNNTLIHTYTSSEVELNNKTFYMVAQYRYYVGTNISSPFNILTSGYNVSNNGTIGYLLLYGDKKTSGGVDGVDDNPDSTQFNPTGVGSVATALGALKNQYPELWDKSIKKSVPQEDGTEDEHVYVPIPIPKFNGAFDTQPTTGTPSQSDPSISPDTTPDDDLNNASNTIAPPSTPSDDPNTGGGNTPSIVVPSQQASALWAIYNPSLSQLNQLGAWLWSTNFIEQILKIFNDPMQAIIGLHKVYATPIISGTGNIKVGYLDSGVGSNIVGNQYTYIDCGTVSLREYYGNILDYNPYTTVQLYLPFIGIVPLDVADVTRSSISVKYGVDVLTGACLASVSVQRDNAGGVLYQYSGNCACQYPLSSGSYMGMVTGAIGAVGSLAKGNIFGTALSIAGMHTTIEHSGGFSGNAGAMGGKKPYLIVSRPQTAMNDGFPEIQGYPSNVFVTLGTCVGYVQVADCHVENISATDKELEKIKQLLKEGVIL